LHEHRAQAGHHRGRDFARIAHEYFTQDFPHEVVGFAVERALLKNSEYLGLPVVTFEEVEQHFDPAGHQAYTQFGCARGFTRRPGASGMR
jgi:hypothetical protein